MAFANRFINTTAINMNRTVKALAFLILLIAFTGGVSAYTSDQIISNLRKIKPNTVDKVDIRKLDKGQVTLKIGFASAVFMQPSLAKSLRTRTIQKIELIYTDFQLSGTFNQSELNKARCLLLLKAIPQIKENDMIEWGVTVQTAAKNRVDARKMFHGFIITVRPPSSKAHTRFEISMMEEALKSVEMEIDSVEHREIKKPRKKYLHTGMYLPISKRKRVKGVLYKRKGIWNRPRQMYVQIDTVTRIKKIVHYKPKKTVLSRKYLSFAVLDSTFFTVMDRHKDWNNILFVTDVTGSMSRYSIQVLLWHKLNYLDKRARQFSFFNDGDNKSTLHKKIGSTGGIYHVKGETYEDVETEIFKTMNRGGGGDGPENDVEALIDGIKSCPDAEQVVLVADNWSNVRDMELLEALNVPVKIIICGSNSAIVNLHYIELAYKTGGSIHTIEQDIDNLMELGSGKSIKIGGRYYLIKDGKFVVLSHT